jgi:origin recognition complex subunit 4
MGNGTSALSRTTAATGAPQRDTDPDPSSPLEDIPSVSADENGDTPSQAKAEKDDTDSPAAEPSPPAFANHGTDNGDSSLAITVAQLVGMRSALRERLQDDMLNQYSFLGDRECVATLVSLFERTVTSGQNQSGLLIGSAGFGQKQIIASALRELRSRCASGGPGFTHVYLNGTILQNEIEAFKELLAQLSRNKSIKHPALSYSSMYSYLRSLLRARAEAGQPVLVVLDGLEHFAHTQASAKQLLLYNLLDWLQFKDVQMGVLGITEDFCIMDSMEKRVRSRYDDSVHK